MSSFYIPCIPILLIFFVNLAKQRRLFCVSNIALLYISAVFLGAPLLYLNPRSGLPFSNINASIYLAFAYSILALPLLFMKERDQKDLVHPDEQFLERIFTILIIVSLPAALYYSSGLKNILSFLQSTLTREEVREDISRQIMGNPLEMYSAMIMTISKINLFLGAYALIFRKGKKWQRYCLLLCGMPAILRSMTWLARSVLFDSIVFILLILIAFSAFVEPAFRKQIKKILLMSFSILIAPMLLLTYARFGEESLFQSFAYFCEGPYFFSTHYTVFCEIQSIPLFNGSYLTSFFSRIYHILFGGLWIEYDPNWKMEYFTEFYYLNFSYPGEFSTLIGNLLQDWTQGVVMTIIVCISIFFCFLFAGNKNNRLSTIYLYVLFAHFVVMGTIGFFYSGTPGNLEIVFLFAGYLVLKHAPKQTEQNVIAVQEQNEPIEDSCCEKAM